MIFFEYEQVVKIHSFLIAKRQAEWIAFVIKIFWIRHLAGFPTNTNKNISQKKQVSVFQYYIFITN